MGTIGSLAARILADAAGVKAGMGIAKQELKVARQAFVDSRTDVERYGAALDKLKSAAKQGAFADPRQYARALAALKEQLDPVTIAQRKLDLATTETAARIRDHLHPGMRQYRDDIRAAKQALDAGKISQAEYAAEKRRLASLLPQVKARQEAATQADREATRVQQDLIDKHQARLKALRQQVQAPWQPGRETWSAANTEGLSKWDRTKLRMRGAGQMAESLPIPILQRFGSALANTHPAVLALNGVMGAGRVAAYGLTAAYGAVSYAVWQQMAAMRELEQQAAKVGMQAGAFLSLSRGAELANVSSDALVNAMIELQKRTIENGSALQNLTPNEQFLEMLDRIRSVPGTAAQAAAAMKAFGDQGKELLPIIRMNAAEYETWKQTVAATKIPGMDQAGQIREANRAVLQLKFAWEDMSRVMAGQAAPYIQSIAQSLRQWLSEKENIDTITSAVDVLAGTLQGVSTAAIGTVSAFGRLEEATGGAASKTVMVGGALVGLATAGGTTIAVCGQMVTWYRTLQTTAAGARVAQLALNTAVGVGYVAAVGAALVAGYSLGNMLVNQTRWAKDAAKAYEEYSAGVKSLQSREAKQREDTLAGIQAAPQQQRGSMLQAEMAMAQKQLDGLTARAEMAKREMDRLQPSWLSLGQAGKKIWEAQAAEYEALKTRAAEAGNWINTLESEMRKGAQTAPLTPAVATPTGMAGDAGKTLRQETDELVNSLQQQMQEVGKTADQVALLRLEARGLGPEWLRVIAVMQSDLAAARQAADMQANVDQLTASLREQIATAGMSADQVERWKLANAGATAAQLGQVAALQQQATAAREQQAAQQAAVDAQKSLRDNLSQTTAALREQIATAGMSADEITRWKLAQQGATPEQLAAIAALQQQAKGLQDVSRETRTAKADTGGWTAATRGSSEALDRIDAYRRMLAADSAPKPPKPQTTPAIATGPVAPVPPQTITPAPIAAGIQPTWTPPPPAPVLPPVPAQIQTAWSDILGQPPAPEPIAAGIRPTWTPPPPAPVLPPVPAQIQTAWGDILGRPQIPPGPRGLVGPPIVNEGPSRRSAREAAGEPPAGESPNVLLGQVVELLKRIATASEDDKITVEQTA